MLKDSGIFSLFQENPMTEKRLILPANLISLFATLEPYEIRWMMEQVLRGESGHDSEGALIFLKTAETYLEESGEHAFDTKEKKEPPQQE